jgi:DNA-binding NtrC family response regulator
LNLAQSTVLVVDDCQSVLTVVAAWLAEAGYSVVSCDRYETAKRELMESRPGIILTDVRLGAFNGLQLVIFANEQIPRILSVVMSAYDDPILRREAEQLGARYLMKPFTKADVLQTLIGLSQVQA